MILLFVFIHILTLQRIFVDCMQTTAMLEERLVKLERKGIEQEAIIQKLVTDMEEQRMETKAQAEMIHDLSMKLEQQAEQLILKENVISELEHKLDNILERQYSTDEKFKNMSGDNFDRSSGNEVSAHKDATINDDNFTTANSEKRSIRQRRLQLPVPTYPPKMNIAFRAWKMLDNVNSTTLVHDFDKVYLNLGGGFEPNSGNFTAPISGLYLFILSVQDLGLDVQGYASLSVLINSKSLDWVHLNSQSALVDESSVTIIAEVKTGDIASVYSDNSDKTAIILFSGVLISQM